MKQPNEKVYYIGHGKIEGPLSIIEISVQRTSPWTIARNITATSEMNKEYRGKEYDFKTAEQLINTPIWVDGKIPTVIAKIENKEVTSLFSRYGCYIIDLNRISLKPDENFHLTKDRQKGKVPEMNKELQNICKSFEKLEEFCKEFVGTFKSLTHEFQSLKQPQNVGITITQADFKDLNVDTLKSTYKKLIDSYREDMRKLDERTFELALSEKLLKVASQPNKKILVLDSRRSLLKQAFEIGAGTQIDIIRNDDPRIGQKNYDLIIGEIRNTKATATANADLLKITTEQIFDSATKSNVKILITGASYRLSKQIFEKVEKFATEKGLTFNPGDLSKGFHRWDMKIGRSRIIAAPFDEKIRGYRFDSIILADDSLGEKRMQEGLYPFLSIRSSNLLFPISLLSFKWD